MSALEVKVAPSGLQPRPASCTPSQQRHYNSQTTELEQLSAAAAAAAGLCGLNNKLASFQKSQDQEGDDGAALPPKLTQGLEDYALKNDQVLGLLQVGLRLRGQAVTH